MKKIAILPPAEFYPWAQLLLERLQNAATPLEAAHYLKTLEYEITDLLEQTGVDTEQWSGQIWREHHAPYSLDTIKNWTYQ